MDCATKPFDIKLDASLGTEEEVNEEDKINQHIVNYEDFLVAMEEEEEVDSSDFDPAYLNSKLQNFSFKRIRDQGIDNCGPADNILKPILSELPNFVRIAEVVYAPDEEV